MDGGRKNGMARGVAWWEGNGRARGVETQNLASVRARIAGQNCEISKNNSKIKSHNKSNPYFL